MDTPENFPCWCGFFFADFVCDEHLVAFGLVDGEDGGVPQSRPGQDEGDAEHHPVVNVIQEPERERHQESEDSDGEHDVRQ